MAAALLVLLALALTVREATGQDPSAVVFARDVPAGAAVTADDVSSVRVPPHLLPADALTDPGAVEAPGGHRRCPVGRDRN
ncbi:SAF domain-containing protein [Corynebacterium suedekumii]|nr:SAF domain-containing protein [Corynebacterium suedekumii]